MIVVALAQILMSFSIDAVSGKEPW